jgi:hypothetical protein
MYSRVDTLSQVAATMAAMLHIQRTKQTTLTLLESSSSKYSRTVAVCMGALPKARLKRVE